MKTNPKKTANPRNKERAEDKTTMTISLPKALKSAIEAEAKKENRPVSNYLVTELMKELAKKGITISLLVLAITHLTRSPANWSLAALKKTGSVILATAGAWIK